MSKKAEGKDNIIHHVAHDIFKDKPQITGQEMDDVLWVDTKNKPQKRFDPVELKDYEVWMEGYAVTGNSADASLVGKVKARSFKEACHILMCKKYLKQVEQEHSPKYEGYRGDPDRWDYNPQRGTVWACRLFDNEADARKSFG